MDSLKRNIDEAQREIAEVKKARRWMTDGGDLGTYIAAVEVCYRRLAAIVDGFDIGEDTREVF